MWPLIVSCGYIPKRSDLMDMDATGKNPSIPETSVSSYNVVWSAPGGSSADSMPLGNGDIGLNVWT